MVNTYSMIEKIFENRIGEIERRDANIATAYRLYEHEMMADYGRDDFDENYYRQFVEATSPVIEKLYEEQDDESGSLNNDIYDTSVFTALMCVFSRVYDDLDPIFSRDCIHAGLEAAHYLLVSKVDINSLNDKEKFAMLWAFAELSKTDVEIKNTYDHSLMAGMPQKMSRQKKYKMFVNSIVEAADLEAAFVNEEIFDIFMFSLKTILLEEEDDIFSDNTVKCLQEKLFGYADSNMEKNIFVLMAYLTSQHILDKDDQIANSSDSQLIKVIEYNVINNKKKVLSDDEKDALKHRMESYEKNLTQ